MKLSVFMPTIRTHLHQVWYDSLEASCDRHDFEVVMCGPFQPPDSILSKTNVTWVKSFASPTVCAQLAAIACNGEYLLHSVDDALYIPHVVSDELDTITDNEIRGMRYREGVNYNGHELPLTYWYCSTAFRGHQIINPNWIHCVHFLVSTKIFIDTGGFDCKYQYLNESEHDWSFRSTYHLGLINSLSKSTITSCSWQEGKTGDHSSIHNAQIYHDQPLFAANWKDSVPDLVIDINNWKKQPDIWKRFTGSENNYSDLPQNM